jgi:hypothetical protein
MIIEKLLCPPMGWNSFDCYGIFINEEQALANLEAFINKLKPAGYEYFVIDAGWYSEYEFQFDKSKPVNKDSAVNIIDEYGRYIASPRLFPRGLKYIADKCHENGVKFGIHIMRGIPREAVAVNTPVKGTGYRAADIADMENICIWCPFLYGVNMNKPGAQEYYDSVVEYLAENDVDFIKADDITGFPMEIEAVARAIDKVDREIVLSLSPGNDSSRTNFEIYKRCSNMVRISSDVWDRPSDLRKSFDRWELWEKLSCDECYIDLDMIPFGALQVYSENTGANEVLAGVGTRRNCQYSSEAKKTFMTQRALAASPLFMGGELTMSPQADIDLVTHPGILECNQNGICGEKIFRAAHVDIRRTPKRGDDAHGWIGIFNRWESEPNIAATAKHIMLTYENLGFGKDRPVTFLDVWEGREINFSSGKLDIILPPHGVLLLKF